ncbi:hypothetical protein KEM56_003331, partial [Ascosphaera pollenicola]
MGNASTKEARVVFDANGRPVVQNFHSASSSSSAAAAAAAPTTSSSTPAASRRPHLSSASSRQSRSTRSEPSTLLGIDLGPAHQVAPRKETRQDREARKREKELALRREERERSIAEEHVDGGYLVALGIYIGHEDWNKKIVRRLIIERRLAPYWRGLNDLNESWATHQLIAAARGLDIPPADVVPPELEIKRPEDDNTDLASASSQSLRPPGSSAAIPIRSKSSSLQPAPPRNPGLAHVQSDDDGTQLSTSSPPFSSLRAATGRLHRARAKTMTALTAKLTSSAAASASADTHANVDPENNNPPEYILPHDPFVNNEPLEVFLYKSATECPICFLYYPPYLNQTRCCQQPICTECFVKIKRPDPHLPEHHSGEEPTDSNNSPTNQSNHDSSGPDEQLISESAMCPYCTRPEFGVTYQPPSFKRGLVYPPSTSYSSTTSDLPSTSTSTTTTTTAPATMPLRRPRSHSLPPSAPGVITTDMIRPDWVRKLQNAREHAARRAAAATALHTAAYNTTGINSRFQAHRPSDPSRHLPTIRRNVLRRATGHVIGGHGNKDAAAEGSSSTTSRQIQAARVNAGAGAGVSTTALSQDEVRNSGDRDSTDHGSGSGLPTVADLRSARVNRTEELMMNEAIRQSILSEEERMRKEIKGARKEAKRQQKEAKKADKQAKKFEASSKSASAANLSLSSSSTTRERTAPRISILPVDPE